MAVPLGKNAVLYYKEGGVTGGGAWTKLTKIKDVTLDLSKDEADISCRATGGYKAKVGTLREGSVDFEMLWDTADPAFQAFFAAWDGDTAIGLKILDGETVAGAMDGSGLTADFSVLTFQKKEPLLDAQAVSVKCAITVTDTVPTFHMA